MDRSESRGPEGPRPGHPIVACGEELAKLIFQNLPESDVQRITEEIAELKNIPPEVSLKVIEEFWELLETQQYMMHGGLEYATKILVETFGKQRAEDMLALVKRAQEASHGNLSMLQKVDPGQLGPVSRRGTSSNNRTCACAPRPAARFHCSG